MIYTTACKPGDIFYGRKNLGYNEIYKFKVLTILITGDDGIWYNCEALDLDGNRHSSLYQFSEEDFKTLMFKTLEAAKNDLEKRAKLYELMDDYTKELVFEENLSIARKLIEKHIVKIEELPRFCNFSENEYLYVKELFQEQIESE